MLQFGTLLSYSPRGQSDTSRNSRAVCGSIKGGRIDHIDYAIGKIADLNPNVLQDFLNDRTVLVPVPRSAPWREGILWPSRVIAERLVHFGYGMSVNPYIARTRPVRKSSAQMTADDRVSVEEHLDSMLVTKDLTNPKHITLVDDVLTLGRTSYACKILLQRAYPEATIRVFTMVRTMGLVPEIDAIFDPHVGTITYNSNSGKTSRHD